jgi:ferredoxin-NADP reductase
MSTTPTIPVTVRRRTEAADGVVLLELAREGGALPNWAPGAHVDVVLPDGRERQYSLCSEPGAPEWRIGVLRESGASAWLHAHAVEGAGLRVRGPRNHFLFAPTAGRRYVFVAGGIGITPILPMLARAAAAGAGFRLLYAGRSRRTMAFLDDLRDAYGDRVEVFAADEGARIDLAAELGEPAERTIVYACGPLRLLDGIETAMAGWPRSSLHVERFEAKPLGPPVWPGPFEVDLLMSGTTVEVGPGESVLDAVEAAGAVVPSSCRVGTCGTCEVAVLDGEIEHRDSVLSAEEQADSRTMMICVSRAACPRITIEL